MYRVVVCAAFLVHCASGFAVQGEKNIDPSTYFVHPKDRNGSSSPRIIGGDVVTPHSYPFQAELLIYKGTGYYFCGGSLISDRLVLTAAHCVAMNPDHIRVGLGKHDITQYESESVGFKTTDYVYHKGWNETTFVNDVALVRLPEKVIFNKYIQPVKLATGSNKYVGKRAILIGWGQTELMDLSDGLKSVNSTIMANNDCANTNTAYQKVLRSSHICTSGAGYIGVCSGDSGGPLLVNGVQVGIVSFGIKNCSAGYPSVFTRVTEFEDWIARGGANTISGHLGAIALVALCFSYIFN